jgi:antitoxin CptB
VNRNLVLKRNIYKSIHRGCKENDILIGEFAKSELEKLSKTELLIYESFLEEDDLEIYNWLLGKEAVPEKYQKIALSIRNFHKIIS